MGSSSWIWVARFLKFKEFAVWPPTLWGYSAAELGFAWSRWGELNSIWQYQKENAFSHPDLAVPQQILRTGCASWHLPSHIFSRDYKVKTVWFRTVSIYWPCQKGRSISCQLSVESRLCLKDRRWSAFTFALLCHLGSCGSWALPGVNGIPGHRFHFAAPCLVTERPHTGSCWLPQVVIVHVLC